MAEVAGIKALVPVRRELTTPAVRVVEMHVLQGDRLTVAIVEVRVRVRRDLDHDPIVQRAGVVHGASRAEEDAREVRARERARILGPAGRPAFGLEWVP